MSIRRKCDRSYQAGVPSQLLQQLTSPPNGATYLIDPTLRMQFQALRLRAAADTPVTWQVNGERVGPRDGVAITEVAAVQISALEDSELLMVDTG